MKKAFVFIFIGIISASFGCSSVEKKELSEEKSTQKMDLSPQAELALRRLIESVELQVEKEGFLNETSDEIEEIEKEKLAQKEGLKEEGLPPAPAEDDPSLAEKDVKELSQIPVQLNRGVKKWLNFFTTKDKERFQRFLDRGEKYKSVVQSVLRENKLPEELFYLAMIESGYSTHAYSRASAVGVWQFIRGTGRRYGLEINYHVDERRDPIRATDAAAKYLRDLHNAFQSWYLAMAAYNCGEYRVLSSIMRSKTRDYWELVEKKALPRETRNYVPKFIAAVIIGRNPEKYGFEIKEIQDYPSVEAVEVPSPVRLRDLAKTSGVSYQLLKDVNPHLRRGITSPRQASYEVWVPTEFAGQVKESESKLIAYQKRERKKVRVASTPSRRTYRVRRGDTLSTVARRNRISVAYLKRVNGLSGNRIYVGQKLRLATKSYRKGATHRVRRGESLSTIARKYGISVRTLRQLNNIRGSRIYAGQRILVSQR